MAASPLQRELKMKNPFGSLEQEAILNLIRTTDQFQNRFGRLFRQFGLTDSQYNVLRILRGEGTPMPILEIGDRMLQVVPAMTGLIDRLEKQSLVERRRCVEDRRVIFIAITTKGLELLENLDKPVKEMHSALVGHLTRAELSGLSRLLEKCRQSLRENGV